MAQGSARRLLSIAAAVTVVASVAGAVGFGVRAVFTHDEAPPANGAAALLLAQAGSEAPVPTGMSLPVARSAEPIRTPHPRLELGTREIRLFGDAIGPMPPPDATALSSNALAGPAEWAGGVLRDAGDASRTLEIAVDGGVRFGVVRDALLQLVQAGWHPTLLLVKDESGGLRVFPLSGRISSVTVLVDANGAEAGPEDGGSGGCTWQRDTPTNAFTACTVKLLERGSTDRARAAEGDASDLSVLRDLQMRSQMLGQQATVAVAPARDARWGDVIAIIDACVGASLEVGLGLRQETR